MQYNELSPAELARMAAIAKPVTDGLAHLVIHNAKRIIQQCNTGNTR
jgi:hypothetical protein